MEKLFNLAVAGTLKSDKGKTQVVLQSRHSPGLNKTHIESKDKPKLISKVQGTFKPLG